MSREFANNVHLHVANSRVYNAGMISIQLDDAKQQRLRELATSAGQDVAQLIQRIVDEYLDAQAWREDSAEDWATASVALTPEILAGESWDDGDVSHESG